MSAQAQPSPPARYILLLGLVAASIIFQLAAPPADWSRLGTVVLQGVTLLVALQTSGVRPLLVRGAAAVVLLAALVSVGATISGEDVGRDAIAIVNLLLVGLAPAAVVVGIVRDIRVHRGVTLAAMFGVLCVYLLLGMFFSFLYGTIDVLGSEPVFSEITEAGPADFLYYSFSTLTTTGYGDLTAAGGVGRAVSILEALIGQIYLVTVVAAIVANLRPRER
jgi:hypothetical protein